MQQTSIIFGAIVLGWIVFAVSRGQLSAYLKVLGLA